MVLNEIGLGLGPDKYSYDKHRKKKKQSTQTLERAHVMYYLKSPNTAKNYFCASHIICIQRLKFIYIILFILQFHSTIELRNVNKLKT